MFSTHHLPLPFSPSLSPSLLFTFCRPVPTVEWFSDNPDQSRFRVISTYFVFVTNASLSDSGTYRCRVGVVEYSASLTVIGVCVGGVRSGCVGGVRSGC